MSAQFDDSPITGVHPLLDREFTPRDCYEYSILTGISPQIIAGIITGRVKPDEEICPRLDQVLGDGVIESLRDDYNPFRDMEFLDPDEISLNKYRLEKRYPVTLIKTGDCIRTRDDRWILISRVRLTPQRVRLFSGPTLCSVTKRDNRAIVAVRTSERVADPASKHEEQARSNMIKERFAQEVLDADRDYRADYIQDMLAAARARRKVGESD